MTCITNVCTTLSQLQMHLFKFEEKGLNELDTLDTRRNNVPTKLVIHEENEVLVAVVGKEDHLNTRRICRELEMSQIFDREISNIYESYPLVLKNKLIKRHFLKSINF